MRQGLRSLLQTYPNVEVVGEATDGEDAVSKTGKLRPAIVLMDINMPKLDGIAATRLIKTNYQDVAVLGLSVNAAGYHADAMLRAGAFAVLTKETAVEELYGAIQSAVASSRPILVLDESATVPGTPDESTISETTDVAPKESDDRK